MVLGSSGNGYFTRGGRRSSPVHSYMGNVKEFKQLLMTHIDTTKMGKLFKELSRGTWGHVPQEKVFDHRAICVV